MQTTLTGAGLGAQHSLYATETPPGAGVLRIRSASMQRRTRLARGSAPERLVSPSEMDKKHLAFQDARGSSMRNVVPRPTSEVKLIEPLCSWTMRKVLASPMPLPPGRVVKKS